DLNEQPPIYTHSKVVFYKWPERNGASRLVGHAYINVPIPAAIVITAKLEKGQGGRYGAEATFSVPPIASGNASITLFKLHFGKG
ncbi:hypothetical protein NL529_31135, partial [Klebsiella pneumoniae]|nr:hypothetical protein [Klebsiella pneumoniae]